MSVSFAAQPDAQGRFGPYGGRYVPETLMDALRQLTAEYESARDSPDFQRDFDHHLRTYVGRPSLLYFAERLTREAGGARIFLKREDLNHTGAHKINNCIGQALLTKRMGKPRVIAETGAGQHGVATATAAALFGLECQVYMGEEDVRRQKLNVFKMKALGSEVVSVRTGSRTLRDAINEAMRDWMATVATTHYIIGSVVGPHPFPMMVREFQSVIGREARAQCLEQIGRLPDAVVACVGGGSNAAGMFAPFLDDASVRADRRRGGRPRARRGRARGHAQQRPARRAARRLQLRPPGRRRPDGRRAFGVGRPGLSRRRPRTQLLEGQPAASATPASMTPRRWRRSAAVRGWRAFCRPWKRPMPWSRPCARRRSGPKTTWWWSAFPAAATRTVSRWPGCKAKTSNKKFNHRGTATQRKTKNLHFSVSLCLCGSILPLGSDASV